MVIKIDERGLRSILLNHADVIGGKGMWDSIGLFICGVFDVVSILFTPLDVLPKAVLTSLGLYSPTGEPTTSGKIARGRSRATSLSRRSSRRIALRCSPISGYRGSTTTSYRCSGTKSRCSHCQGAFGFYL